MSTWCCICDAFFVDHFAANDLFFVGHWFAKKLLKSGKDLGQRCYIGATLSGRREGSVAQSWPVLKSFLRKEAPKHC